MPRLLDRSIVITGAARGIGRAISLRLASEGAAVTCVDCDEPGVAETCRKIAVSDGGRSRAVIADISTPAGNQHAVDVAMRAFGGVDALIANAAVSHEGLAEQASEADWDRIHDVNLKGAFLGVRAVLPALRARGGGTIIFIGSVLAMVGDPILPLYGATKGGLRAMTRSIATAHGHENIRCNTVCPGDVQTAMLEQFLAHQRDPEQARREITAHYPLGRLAAPDDVAGVVAFLASADASYISGTDVVVDGGLLGRIY